MAGGSSLARKTTSLDAFLKTFTGRLKAMASAHELLTAPATLAVIGPFDETTTFNAVG